jgi:acylphosphatase
MKKKRLEARVYGFVQGVGFRYFVKRNAARLGLVGYAKNLPDGSVEVVAEGDENTLYELLHYLREGNAYSHVEKVDYKIIDSIGGMVGFEIY